MDKSKVHAILRADLRGLPDSYIMEKLSISQYILERVRESELYKERFSVLQDKADDMALDKADGEDDPVTEALRKAAVKAAETNISMLGSDSEKVAQASAWDILDRSGHPKTARSEVTQKANVTVDEATMRALGDALGLVQKTAGDADKDSEVVIDGEGKVDE